MAERAVLEWHDQDGLQARLHKQGRCAPVDQLPGIVDWLSMCTDEGIAPTVEGYAEHAYTTDVDLVRTPFPTHVPIPDDVEHVYTLTTGVSPGVYVTVTSFEVATGITHHRAGTDDLADLHLEAAALWERLGEQVNAALREQPEQPSRFSHHPDEIAQASARHRAHALGYSHA
jgi:hypothetical protein